MSTDRIILHIDFDSFFASVEQQYNPRFQNKPLGVTATNGRTCIIASSREAKRLGIGTGCSTYKARIICPAIEFTRADFIKYWEVSKKFISICKDYSPYVEVFSIDELFMDVTKTAYLFGGVENLILRLKKRIREEIGVYITVSVGISYNKLLAKLGSGLKKPNGIVLVGKGDVEKIYQTCQLQAICGIGPRVERRLNQMGIFTLLKLRRAPLHYLVAEFGNVEGRFLRNVGLGFDDRPVVPYTNDIPVKSVSRQYCLPHNEYSERIVLQNVYELCEEIGIKLRRLHKKAKRIGVSLIGDTYSGGYTTWETFINSGKDLFQACIAILYHDMMRSSQNCYKMENPHVSGFITIRQKVASFSQQYFLSDHLTFHNMWQKNHDDTWYTRRISVWAGTLEEDSFIPQSLFFNKRKQEQLTAIVDTLNEKYGDHTIRNGFLLKATKLTTVPNGWMADKVERTKLQQEGLDLPS